MTKNNKIKLGFLAGVGVVAGLGAVALPANTHAATSGDTAVNVTIAESLSLTATSSVSGTLLNGGAIVELKDGSATPASGQFNVVTNHSTGYNVSVKAAGTTGSETKLVSSAVASDTIDYGTPAVGTSAWNMTINGTVLAASNFNTTGYQVYTQSTPTGTTGQTTTVNYNASAAGNQAAGTYAGKVTFTVAANS